MKRQEKRHHTSSRAAAIGPGRGWGREAPLPEAEPPALHHSLAQAFHTARLSEGREGKEGGSFGAANTIGPGSERRRVAKLSS